MKGKIIYHAIRILLGKKMPNIFYMKVNEKKKDLAFNLSTSNLPNGLIAERGF